MKISKNLRVYRILEKMTSRKFLFRLGRFLYLGARREIGNNPDSNGEYALQRWVIDAVAKRSHDGKLCFLDIGANLGDWSAQLFRVADAQELDTRIEIHAFEPAPCQADSTESRLAVEIDAKRFRLHRSALASEEGSVTFVVTGKDTGNNFIRVENTESSGEEIEVPVTTVDSFADTIDVAEITFVKIDTEGNDFNVIVGARELLKSGRILVLQFEYNWRWIDFGHWLKSVFTFTDEFGYVLGLLTPAGLEIYENWHPEMERYSEANYVLIHPDFIQHLPHTCMQYDHSNLPDIRG